jgi:CNT family concentrative nucleoside transporter
MENIFRGILGITILIGILYGFSANRSKIDWKLVGIALGMQIVLGLSILKVDFIRSFFDGISGFFIAVLDYTKEGANFMFAGLMDTNNVGFIFAVQVLPTIIFFSALSSVLYYYGILQKIIYGLAKVMSKAMRLSGAESMAAAANVFIGQTEAPLIIKPYIDKMTKSEILCLMVGGMATLAGGVLAAYIGFLGGDDKAAQQEFATHLLTASIMSAPAAILAAKMLYPETEDNINTDMTIPEEQIGDNVLEAISNGTTDGLKLAVNVGAMLIVFTAFVAMLNSICSGTIGHWFGWASSGGMDLFGNIFNEQQNLLVLENIIPVESKQMIPIVTQDTIGILQDSIVSITEQKETLVMKDSVVLDTLFRNDLDIRWSVDTKNWVLLTENNVAIDTIPNTPEYLSRITLNMYTDQVTSNRFNCFNLEYILGLILSPIAWVLGTPSEDILIVGQLLGKKTIINEFVAYADIPKVSGFLTEKSKIIVTYALCGFANFASIGIQIGGIGAIAPHRRKVLAEFGMKALIGGTIACFLTATIAGMLVG